MREMERVYVLWHVHGSSAENAKLIGVYRTDSDARAAIERLRDRPGFRDHPTGFLIDPYVLNGDHWSEGFSSVPISN